MWPMQAAQLAPQLAVAVVAAGNPEVVVHHGTPVLGVLQQAAHLVQHLAGEEAVHDWAAETLGLDVAPEDGVAVHQHGPAVVDGLEEGVAEALVEAGVGDEVGLLVEVGQGVDLAALRVDGADLAHARGGEAQVHAALSGVAGEHVAVLEALVARLVADHQLVARVAEAAHQLDGVLDALARARRGWAGGSPCRRGPAQLAAQVGGIGVGRRRAGCRSPARWG
jgi:hypothetical protein